MAVQLNLGESLTLSHETVNAWLAERAELAVQLAGIEEHLNDVNEKLHAAYVLLPSLFDSPPVPKGADVEQADSVTDEPQTLSEKILTVIGEHGAGAPRDIRKWLLEGNYVDKLSTNYVYMTLARAVERKKLVKRGDRYSLPQNG